LSASNRSAGREEFGESGQPGGTATATLKVRTYGSSGPRVVVVHGGPGGCGSMAPVARGIADSFRAFEPFQSGTAATVAQHVAEMHEVIERCADGGAPAIVGHSWGGMLALAYAAAHPESAGPIVLICPGTFDLASREQLRANLDRRMDEGMRSEFERARQLSDPNERFHALGALSLRLYSYDLETTEQEIDQSEAGANEATWEDMVRLQGDGTYPRAFRAIKSPVLMLHGAADPHPGRMIRASLEPYLPQLEYREWERCGHYPWLEKATREEFFAVLRAWLADRCA
jgi:pimeloyl-ACP methyl ester carboxylesterase